MYQNETLNMDLKKQVLENRDEILCESWHEDCKLYN